MDQFKPEETLRMEIGGNERLKKYFIDNGVDLNLSPKQKYDNYVAEDYKEMLTCEVEGKEFVAKDHSGEKLPDINNTASTTTDPVSRGRPTSVSLTNEQNRKMKLILLIWVLRMIKDLIIYHHHKVGNMVDW